MANSIRPWDSPEDYLKRTSKCGQKVSKASARYRPAAAVLATEPPVCLKCKFFRHPFLEGGFEPQKKSGSCDLVKGSIQKDFTCKLWSIS